MEWSCSIQICCKGVLFMSKFLNSLVVGLDVAADFSFAAILTPDGSLYRKPFKVNHDADSLRKFAAEIQKVEKLFSTKAFLFMESTGIYHLPLFHFLKDIKFEVFVLNPLITHSNRNNDIRKVKNDKKDAIAIAKLVKYQDVKFSTNAEPALFTLRSLCRQYYSFVDSRIAYKIKLSNELHISFPGYHTVFADITGNTSMAILNSYPSPKSILDAPKETLISLIQESSKKGVAWATAKYSKLIDAATNALSLGLKHLASETLIKCHLNLIKEFNTQIAALLMEIESFVLSGEFPLQAKKNLKLLLSITGVGFISAVTILSEIGNFDEFSKPKQLVAFFGVDPAVNESGKFKGDKVKMSKRGTRYGRRALYAVALACIRKKRNGMPNNPVLFQCYQKKSDSKKKKVAIGAIMHKILNYIFAVLRNQTPYELRSPEAHVSTHFEIQSISA
jgi:Transposase and inactivated derivatives